MANAVGSISHILSTSFKDDYEILEKRSRAAAAREELRIKLAEDERRRLEALAAEEARVKAEAEEAAKKMKKGTKKDQSRDKKGKKNEPEPPPVPVIVEEVVEAPADVIDPSTLIQNFYTDFEKLTLDENLHREMEERFIAIDADFTNRERDAKELNDYFVTQLEKAHQEEELEEENLKKQGIIVGQHIPALKTKLRIERDYIESFKDFSGNLLIASDLIEENQINNLRRSGNLPITAAAEERMLERSIKKSSKLRRTSTVTLSVKK